MKYHFRPAESFWKSFYELPSGQKASTRAAWRIFRSDPFDPRLGTHKIRHLSSLSKRTVYAVCVENNLRVLFTIIDDVVLTLDVGTHDIYKR